jgi:hypothetical protein
MEGLPKELLCLIVSKLRVPFEIAQCRLVCKQWDSWIKDKGSALWGNGAYSFLDWRRIIEGIIPLRYRELYFSGHCWDMQMTLRVCRLFAERDEDALSQQLLLHGGPDWIKLTHDHVAILFFAEGLLTTPEQLFNLCRECREFLLTDFSLMQMRQHGKRYLEVFQQYCPKHDFICAFLAQKVSLYITLEEGEGEREQLYNYLMQNQATWLSLFLEGNVLYALRKGLLHWRTFSRSDDAFKTDWEMMAVDDKQFEQFCVASQEFRGGFAAKRSKNKLYNL